MPATEDLEIFPLEGTPPLTFRCTRDEQNDFLHGRAWDEQRQGFSVSYLAHRSGIMVGYMTLTMDGIPLQQRERPSGRIKLMRFPALKLAQLGVDERWEGRGIGKQLVAFAAAIGLRLGAEVGCRYLTVDAKTDLVPWYKGQEFKENRLVVEAVERRARERGLAPEDAPRSMRLDLHSLLADLRDRYPHDFPRE